MSGLHEMNLKRVFVCVLVAGLFVLIAVYSIVYAGTVTNVALYGDDESSKTTSIIIPVGETAHLYARCEHNENPDNDGIEWTFDLDADGTYDTTFKTNYGPAGEHLSTTKVTEPFNDSGEYTVSVKARLDDGKDTWQGPAACGITVVGVEKVVKAGESEEDGLILVCLYGGVDLEAIPDTGSTFPTGEPGWMFIPPAGATATLSTASGVYTTIEHMETKGIYKVFARSDHFESTGVVDEGDSIIIAVLVVGKLTNLAADDEGPLYVCVNDNKLVMANPEPYSGRWPDGGNPTWTISGPEGTSPSLKPRIDIAKATGFTEPGDYTVTANCGPHDTGDELTITAFEVVIDTLDPANIIFGESLSLGCTPEPSDIEGGTYLWEKVRGPGTVTFSSCDERSTDFSTDVGGEYTVKVSYTVEGETATDTSDLITVYTCDIRKCAPLSGSNDLLVDETNEDAVLNCLGTSAGFKDEPLDPIAHIWILSSTEETVTTIRIGENSNISYPIPDVPDGADGANYLALSVNLEVADVDDRYTDSHSVQVYREVSVEKLTEYRNENYCSARLIGSVCGTNGQNPQQASFGAGNAETVTRNYSVNSLVAIDLELIKLAFGGSVGGSVSSSESYGVGIAAVDFNGNTQGVASWRRRFKREQKGDVIRRDEFGARSDLGDVWVDEISWQGAMVIETKEDLNAGNFHTPSGW